MIKRQQYYDSLSLLPDSSEFLDFSKQFIAYLIETNLSDKGKILCVSEGNLVVRKTIVDNARSFVNILSILFDVTTVGNNWSTLMVSDVNEFYKVLKNRQRIKVYGA